MKAFTSLSEPASASHGFDGAAGIAHQLGGLVDAIGAIDRDQLGAFLGEQQRGRAPDAASRAGDDDGFAFEAAHEFLPARVFTFDPWRLAASTEFKQDFKRSRSHLETMCCVTYSDDGTLLKGSCDVQSRQAKRDRDAVVVGAPCAGAQRRRQHLRAEGHRLRHRRRRSVRGGRQDAAARCGLVRKQSAGARIKTAEAIWAAGFPKPASMAQEVALRRAASRPMARA